MCLHEKCHFFRSLSAALWKLYYIREDGSTYSLSGSGAGYILGDLDFFIRDNESIYVEAVSDVICIVVDMDKYWDALAENHEFLYMIGKSLAIKMQSVTKMDTKANSLEERVHIYMKYKCEDRCIHGLEHAAFRLHCSPRQLQRIMNKLEEKKIVERIRKGTYRLLEGSDMSNKNRTG